MPNVLDRLSPGFQAVTAMFAAASLDLAAMIAAGSGSLKTHLESLKGSSSDVASAVEAATTELQVKLTAEEGKFSAAMKQAEAHNARLALHAEALSKFGATPKASDEKAGVTAADIEASLKARASIMAADQLAKHGLAASLPLAPAADPTKAPSAADTKPKGLKKVLAAFQAESARATAAREV